MAYTSQIYQQILGEHRRRLDRLTERRAVAKLQQVYTRAEDVVARRLEQIAGRGSAKFTVGINQAFQVQLRHGQTVMAHNMAAELGTAARDAQVDTLHGFIGSVKTLERVATGITPVLPVEEISRFSGVVDRRRSSLLRQHRTSMSAYGARLVGQIEGDLAVSLASGESVDDAIGRVRTRADNEWWQAERIVRTETAWAANATNVDGARAVAQEVPDLWMRWTEHVSDEGFPLDDRVGEDSIVMHGQVARPGGMFTMPPDHRVSVSLQGRRWGHPPNRPNDRAVVVPWSPRWGAGTGWEWRGARVPVR